VIEGIVLEATGNKAEAKERLIAGEVNEVWSVVTAGGPAVIVRISHHSDPGFENEKWALEISRQAGVPTPQVLLIKHFTDKDRSKTVCVETKLEGTALSKILLDNYQQPLFAAEIARTLEKIHSIKLDGFSYSHERARATPKSFAGYIADSFKDKDKLQALAAQNDLSEGTIARTIKVLSDYTPIYETITQATLTHGDWGADHLLFENDKLTGVIDMENAKGGDISYDLAWWDFYWASKIPTYMIVKSLNSRPKNLDDLINLQALRLALRMLEYYTDTNNSGGLNVVRKNFDRYLAKF
jgi:aminoglycoside phosphotransferase (APT) family kinase protein